MFLQSSSARIRTLFNRMSSSDSVRINQGALYITTSRGMANELGSGSGRGGGSGGSVREAGGAIGKKGAAQEEMYFSKQNRAMTEKMKEHLTDEIKKHEEAIKAKKELVKELESKK